MAAMKSRWMGGVLGLLGLLVAQASVGCSDEESAAATGGAGGAAGADASGIDETTADAPLELECDPIVPQHCAFPFPNDTWTTADPASPTGKRVKLSQAMLPTTRKGVAPTPADYGDSDGFSPGVALLAFLPGATTKGLPTPLTIASSLEDSSPTVLIEAESGQRVPHFSELDLAARDRPDEQTFMIRPAVRLKDKTRYIVAIRKVVDENDKAIDASPAFQALRDKLPSEDPAVKGRRGRFGDIFRRLEKAGVARADLQLAWDFTTASRENNTADMIAMRDKALAAVGQEGPQFILDKVDTAWNNDTTAIRIDGRMKVPLYLDKPGPGARVNRGADGKPAQNGEAEFPFVATIPQSAQTGDPAAVLWYGHGQLGDREESLFFRDLGNEGRFAIVSSDWSGFAAEDTDHIVEIITSGRIGEFRTVGDRMQQGMLNALLLTRMATGRLADAPEVVLNGRSAIRKTEPYYFGGSQGGILGGTYMALSTDVSRGILAVPGQSYNLLLQRSKNFDPFFTLLKPVYNTFFDIQMVLSLIQMHWDRAEPTGYSSYIRQDMLPGTPSHEVLLLNSIGDHQVTTLGAHIMARAIGAKNLKPVNRSIFGIDEADGPFQGSAMIEFDFGLPPEPIGNEPMRLGDDPHGSIREVPAALVMISNFLRQGTVQNLCTESCNPD
jgi:hypothetical protein